MLGDNPKRPPVTGDGSVLFVKNMFKTLQGEGPHVGVSSVFIRLGGCNLACSFCDTEFEDYEEYALDSLLQEVNKLSANDNGVRSANLVVITGGEPLRQPIGLLCQKLIELGYEVQIETNGTLYRELPKEVDIICSPKVSANKYLSVHGDLLPRVNAFKFLVSVIIKEYSAVPELGQTKHNIPVYVQAMDQQDEEINAKNQKLAVELAINNDYRLSYQVHKKLGIE